MQIFFFNLVNLRFNVNCLLYYGKVPRHTVKSQCRRQGSIPNRWDVIKVQVSVSIQRHRAQVNFLEHNNRQRDEVIIYSISCMVVVIPNEPLLFFFVVFFLTIFDYTVFDYTKAIFFFFENMFI